MKTGIKATRLALAGFLLPFVMIYSPAILMIGDASEILIVGITALLGVYALAVSSIGFFFTNCTILERFLCGAAGIAMVIPHTFTSVIGLVILIAVAAVNKGRAKKKNQAVGA